jgi:hypothetical protein
MPPGAAAEVQPVQEQNTAAIGDQVTHSSVEWALPVSGQGGIVLFASLVLIVGIGVVDVASGTEFMLSDFYLLAIIIGTWRGGLRVGLALAVTSAIVGLLADLLLSEPYLHLANSYSSAWVPSWNAVAQALVLLAAVLSVSKLQDLLCARDRAVRELGQALGQIRTLESLLSICAWCRRIRDESDASKWTSIEQYIAEHTDTKISHGMCPDCFERVWEEDGLGGPP